MFDAERRALQQLRGQTSANALGELRTWLQEARRTGDAGLIADGLFELSHLQRAAGQLVDALESVSQAAALAESINELPLLFKALIVIGILKDDLGQTEDGLQQIERALTLDWQPPPDEEARAKGVAGAMLSRIDRHPQALVYLRRAIDVAGQDEHDRIHRHMSLIWHLCDDLGLPSEAEAEWEGLRASLGTTPLKGWLRTAFWATSIGVWAANRHTAPLLTTGRVMLEEHARQPHVATGWACAMALDALAKDASVDEAARWAEIAEPQASLMRSLDRRRWLLALARLATRRGDTRRARQLRGSAGALVKPVRRRAERDVRLLLADLRGLEVRLALAKSEREADALRREITRREAQLRVSQALPPSLLSELLQLSGRHERGSAEPELGLLGFHLVFQPFLDTRERRLVGCETLLRLDHPVRGPLTPAEFIPRLDASGEIDLVGRWVLAESCRQLHEWQASGLSLSIAVNVTANQLNEGGFAALVASLLERHGLAAHQLELEITETIACSEANAVVEELERLNALGVRVSVDDFGTGYSNFARLLDIAPSKVKIDRSLITRLDSGDRAVRTVRTLINSAHSMAMSVTAEGIETVEAARLLTSLGCDLLQGYLIGKPQPAGVLVEQLRSGPDRWAPFLG